jgi:hypothetical protein
LACLEGIERIVVVRNSLEWVAWTMKVAALEFLGLVLWTPMVMAIVATTISLVSLSYSRSTALSSDTRSSRSPDTSPTALPLRPSICPSGPQCRHSAVS